jgi:hypothetical protein
MKDEAHPSFLAREETAEQIKHVFSPQLDLLTDLVNYGSNLILRTSASSKKDISDAVIIHNFLKQAVVTLDGIHLCIGSGSASNGFILLRSLFEINLYLEWIFEKDTQERGLLYYIWDLRNKRFWNRRLIPGTPENLEFSNDIKYEPPPEVGAAQDPVFLQSEIDRIDAILAKPEYTAINAKFAALNGKYTNWYSPYFGSVKKIAEALKREGRYHVFYSSYSKYTHGLAMSSQFVAVNGQMHITGIRAVEGIDQLLQGTYIFAHEVFYNTLKHYRPDEVKRYCLKYVKEWRFRILSTPIGTQEKDGKINFTIPTVKDVSPDALNPENFFNLF